MSAKEVLLQEGRNQVLYLMMAIGGIRNFDLKALTDK